MTFIAAGAKYLDREVAATEVCADALYDLAVEVPPSSNSISSPFFLKLVTNFPCMSHIVFGNAAFQKILSSTDVSMRFLCKCPCWWPLGTLLAGRVNPTRECQPLARHSVSTQHQVLTWCEHTLPVQICLKYFEWETSSCHKLWGIWCPTTAVLKYSCIAHSLQIAMMLIWIVFILLDAPAMHGFNFVTMRPLKIIYSLL